MDVLLMKMMGMEEVFDDIISVVRECCIMSTNQICIASAQIQMWTCSSLPKGQWHSYTLPALEQKIA